MVSELRETAPRGSPICVGEDERGTGSGGWVMDSADRVERTNDTGSHVRSQASGRNGRGVRGIDVKTSLV